MSRGLRQFALGDNEEDKKKEETYTESHRGWDYPHYNYPYSDSPPYTPKKTIESYRDYDCKFLKPSQIKITLAISMKEIGPSADPDNADYDLTNMYREAKSLAIRKFRKMNLFDLSKYGIKIDSEESLDTVEVSITLTPKTS